MVQYRRLYVPGGTYFFTLALRDRKSDWLIKYIEPLKKAMQRIKIIHPYKIIALVILPDHLHAVWELPENDSNYSLRWRCIKTQFARNLKKLGIDVIKNTSGENLLWQRRYWEHLIRNEKDRESHVNYIHYNPVKHRLVRKVENWPFSTFHRYVKNGLLPRDWDDRDNDLNLE